MTIGLTAPSIRGRVLLLGLGYEDAHVRSDKVESQEVV